MPCVSQALRNLTASTSTSVTWAISKATGRPLNPILVLSFDEIIRAEPPDKLDAGTVLFRHRLDFECHIEPGEQRTGQ